MQEAKDEPAVLQLTLVDPNGVSYPIRISSGDAPIELRSCLQEFAPTCYFTQYEFQVKGETLNQYFTFNVQGVVTGSVVTMVIENYHERGVKEHIERLKDVMRLPPPSTSYILATEGQAEEQLQTAQNSVLPPITSDDFLPDPSKLPNPTSLLHPYKLQDEIWTRTKCLHSLTYSQFNPPRGKRMLQGDINYLQVHVLEGNIYHVTAHSTGFFVNSTHIDAFGVLQFSPDPAENTSLNKTLVGLLEQISPLFKEKFQHLLSTSSEWETLRYVKSSMEAAPWVGEERQMDAESRVDSLRDWNEELQQIQSVVDTTVITRIQKEKRMAQVYTEFVEAAISGARDMVAGAFQPLNPMDHRSQQVFVFNNIFFSFTEDKEYVLDQSPESCATNVSANHDVRAIKIFNSMDLPELHTIATAIVDFRGFRVLCQSILPGILTQNPETTPKYGSMDDGQSIFTDPEFHALVTSVAERLHLSPSTLLDKEGGKHVLAAGFDLKGMVGSDQRKYLLENFRTTPRDTNKMGPEYTLCLVRPELLELYQQMHNRSFIDARIDEIMTTKKATSEDPENVKITMDEIKEVLAQAPKFNFNPNVFTCAKFAEPVLEEEEKVKELSNFLKNVQVVMVGQVLCTEEGWWPRLGTNIVDVLHQFGVNARYLGAVSREIEKPESRHIKWQCEVCAVARSVKHIFNLYLRETPDYLLASVITHLLNCVFNLPKREAGEESKEGKKKRKKKAKKPARVLPPPSSFRVLALSKEEVWGSIVEFTQRHFDLTIPSHIDDWEAVKLASFRTSFLREICLQTGIQLAPSNLVDKFTTDSISGLNHKVKAPDWKSIDSKWLYENAIKAMGEKKSALATELLMQSASVQASISGPVHKDIAACYQRISSIYFSDGDLTHAVMYQHKAIVLYERALGLDHPVVAQNYLNFAYLYQSIGRLDRSFKHILRACELYALNGCENSPEAINALSSLAVLYRDANMHEMAIAVLIRVLDCYVSIYGDVDARVAECCQVLAFQYKMMKDYDKAVELQSRALEIFKKVLPAEDPRTRDTQAMLEAFIQHSSVTEQEGIRESKAQKQVKTDRNTMLRQRLHLRKLQAKMNVPRSQIQYNTEIYEGPDVQLTQEQIEDEKTRLLIEEINKKGVRR